MRQLRLRTLLLVVALVAVTMGLTLAQQRRTRRLIALALDHGREADQLEKSLMCDDPSDREVVAILERVHWHDSVAARYQAAARSWLPTEPDPRLVVCECGYHAPRAAVTGKPRPNYFTPSSPP